MVGWVKDVHNEQVSYKDHASASCATVFLETVAAI